MLWGDISQNTKSLDQLMQKEPETGKVHCWRCGPCEKKLPKEQ